MPIGVQTMSANKASSNSMLMVTQQLVLLLLRIQIRIQYNFYTSKVRYLLEKYLASWNSIAVEQFIQKAWI
jgi:hypothetical protein